MFAVTVKPHGHLVQVTTRHGDGKTSVLILRPGESREFLVTGEVQHEFEEIAEEKLLGTRAGEEAEA